MSVTRIAISLEPELVKKLDGRMRRKLHFNRSKEISDILRDSFLKEELAEGNGRTGVISVVYDHRKRGVQERITEMQHLFGRNIIATMHVHLSRDECLEIIATKGSTSKTRKIADSIAATRGVKNCKLLTVA